MDGRLDLPPTEYSDLFESGADAAHRNACILVAGARGSAGAAVTCLAKAGVSAFRLADAGEVTREELRADAFASIPAVGKPRVKALADDVLEINPATTIDLVLLGVTEDNAGRLTEDVTHVLCEPTSMSEASIRWLDDAASAAGLPIVIGRSAGLVSGITTCAPEGPGLVETLDAFGVSDEASCSWASVPVAMVTGARMALEMMSLLAGKPPVALAPEYSRLHLYEHLAASARAS